jgi:hypothetical protein
MGASAVFNQLCLAYTAGCRMIAAPGGLAWAAPSNADGAGRSSNSSRQRHGRTKLDRQVAV